MQRLVHYFLKALDGREDGTGFQAFACPVQATKQVAGEVLDGWTVVPDGSAGYCGEEHDGSLDDFGFWK